MAPRTISLTADYLVVGAGAMGLAFADEIICTGSDKSTTVILVDTRASVGGHWNDAYDFVRLHQPAAYYGVNSEVLGSGGSDLASKYQILAYFEKVLKKLEGTGQLQFYPQCRYNGDGRFTSVLDPELEYVVDVRRKMVDASYLTTKVPSTHPPKYTVHPGVTLVPINGLARLDKSWEQYVVIGAGKTGIDAVLRLLDLGVGQDKITWIVPNDPWMQNRDQLQVTEIPAYIDMEFEIIPSAVDGEDAYKKMEQAGFMMRLDPSVWPTKQKCATVSSAELKQLRTLRSVVRQGRVAALHLDRVEFQNGTDLPCGSGWLYVDCTSDGLASTPSVPIFQDKKLVLQPVSLCQQVKSAAAIAALELRPGDIEKKNAILVPVPHPNHNRDLFKGYLVTLENDARMVKEGAGLIWEKRSRLNFTHHIGLWDQAKLMVTLLRKGKMFEDKLRELAKETNRDCRKE